MNNQRITKQVVDRLKGSQQEYALWDAKMPGFGVRVRPTGSKTYVVVYRAGSGRGAPFRRFTIAPVGQITPETPEGARRLSLVRWRMATIRQARRLPSVVRQP
jgi:Arm DNA-binding domain